MAERFPAGAHSDNPTDAELVRAAQGGDTAGLAGLLQRHRATMHAVALSIVGFSADVEDIVHDCMVVALRRIGDLRNPAAVEAWLKAIVRNACRMRLRAPVPLPLRDPEILSLPSAAHSPEEMLERHALRDWVWHALAELSEPLRVAAILRYFSSTSSYMQIAALCGVPLGTVRSRLNQVKRKLADTLLATDGLVHDDAEAFTARRRQDAALLVAPVDIKSFSAVLADGWSPQAEILGPNGQKGRGLDLLIRIMESDLQAGVHQRLVNVIASRNVTILEADLLSPKEDPNHCPPSVVWLQVLRSGHVKRLRLFHPAGAPEPPESA